MTATDKDTCLDSAGYWAAAAYALEAEGRPADAVKAREWARVWTERAVTAPETRYLALA